MLEEFGYFLARMSFVLEVAGSAIFLYDGSYLLGIYIFVWSIIMYLFIRRYEKEFLKK